MPETVMTLFLLSYLGGVLTILSPCILPVLPFVFARSDRPFLQSGLPLLLGMAVTFAVIATLATVGGSWAVHANQWGRLTALLLLALFGLTLLVPLLADRLTRPLVALGSRLSNEAGQGQGGVASSLLLGVATGLLWAPCAGPILGLILTGAHKWRPGLHHFVAFGLRARRGHLARSGAADRRPRLCRHEKKPRRR
jgi:cytochrome c biogenesis protein CcdA